MLEDRLESVERQLIRLTKTLQDLITMYVETNADSILSGMPKHSKYVPKFVKDRDKNMAVDLPDVRHVTEVAITIFGSDSVSEMLTMYLTKGGTAVTCLADLQKSDYKSFYDYLTTGLKAYFVDIAAD